MNWGGAMRLFFIGFVFWVLNVSTWAEPLKAKSGFLDFNLYPYLSDVDNDNTLTINALANLPGRFQYFSLTNFGNQIAC